MPTMILTFAWLLTATTHVAAPTPTSASLVALTATSFPQPILVALAPGNDSDESGWLLFETDTDEETDSETDSWISSPHQSWPAVRSPFGFVVSNPHPVVLACSALRSPRLRC